MRALALVLVVALTACSVTPVVPPAAVGQPVPPVPRLEVVQWSQVPGWNEDALTEAWPALLASCAAKMPVDWRDSCTAARAISREDANAQRKWLESSLRAWRITTQVPGKKDTVNNGRITGYYEPMLNGARTRGGAYQTPLYSVPDDLLIIELGDLYPALKGERVRGKLQGKRVVPYPDRALLTDGKALAGKELVWVDSAVDAFFLQIQGSGRVQHTLSLIHI
jgi:membrane-bound lytic murein transglycosylase A